jgi:hypothetical protein
MYFNPCDAPASVELSASASASSLSLAAVPPYRPVIRGVGDFRHLPIIASFARECCPSDMIVDSIDGYAVTFRGADRYRMAIYLLRYLTAHGMARVVWSGDSCRPFRGRIVYRNGAEIAAFTGKTYVFIGFNN